MPYYSKAHRFGNPSTITTLRSTRRLNDDGDRLAGCRPAKESNNQPIPIFGRLSCATVATFGTRHYLLRYGTTILQSINKQNQYIVYHILSVGIAKGALSPSRQPPSTSCVSPQRLSDQRQGLPSCRTTPLPMRPARFRLKPLDIRRNSFSGGTGRPSLSDTANAISRAVMGAVASLRTARAVWMPCPRFSQRDGL